MKNQCSSARLLINLFQVPVNQGLSIVDQLVNFKAVVLEKVKKIEDKNDYFILDSDGEYFIDILMSVQMLLAELKRERFYALEVFKEEKLNLSKKQKQRFVLRNRALKSFICEIEQLLESFGDVLEPSDIVRRHERCRED
jgi:hypothetical protein